MGTKFENAPLAGVVVCLPDIFPDSRGFFTESYQAKRYFDGGVKSVFVQDNRSRSVKNVLRGLHYQLHKPQAKLVECLEGAIWDVAVDIRVGSPTFKQWFGIELSAENRKQLYIPQGFAHGFCVLSAECLISYKCSYLFEPMDDRGILWNDPAIAVSWPVADPILSHKDTIRKSFAELTDVDLPRFS